MTENQTLVDVKAFMILSERQKYKHIKSSETEKMISLLNQLASFPKGSKNVSLTFINAIAKFIKIHPEELENEELVKLLLKFTVDVGGKHKNDSSSIKTQLSNLLSKIANSSKCFTKFFKLLFKKIDFSVLNNMLEFFKSVENNEIIMCLFERVKEEIGKMQTHRKPWNPNIFFLLSKVDQLSTLVALFRDLIRQNIAHVHNLADVLSNLDLKDIEKKAVFEDIFDANYNDAFSQDENLSLRTLQMATSILSENNSSFVKSKVENFISFLNQKMNRNQSQELNFAYCNLIARVQFSFDSKITNETISQFIDSFGMIKSQIQTNFIGKLFSENKSLMSTEILQYQLDRKKQIEQPVALYLVSSLGTKSDKYAEFLQDFYDKNNKQKIIFSNCKNYLFSIASQIENSELPGDIQFDFLKKVVSRDDYFVKTNFFEGILRIEIDAILKIISAISNEALSKIDFSQSEKNVFGHFVLQTLNSYFKTWHKLSIQLPKKVIKLVLKSLLVLLHSENKQKIADEKYGSVLKFAILDCKFMTKNQTMFYKVIALISSDHLVEKNDLTAIIKSEFFKIKMGDNIPDAFYRIFSTANLFEDSQNQFYSNFFMNLLYFFPNLLHQTMFFFSKRNLIYLLSMSHFTESIDNVKPFNISCLFDREEFELIGIKEKAAPVSKGKSKQVKEESFDDVKFLAEAHNFDAEAAQNEDEKFDELKLENNKQAVLSGYGVLLEKLSEAYLRFFDIYLKVFTQQHIQIIEKQLHVFKDSFKTVAYFSETLNKLYGCFLRHSSHNCSKEFSQLLEFNFGIIRQNDSPQFVRNVEYFIRVSNFSKLNVTREIFAILFDTMCFVFENKIDTEYKRKIFYFVYKSLASYPEYVTMFIQFICKNFNELNFEEAFESFREILVKLIPSNSQIINETLNDVLTYEDFVVHYLLKTLMEVSKTEDISNQKITVLQLLKILILTENEDEKTSILAKGLIATNQLYKFGSSMFESLNFRRILLEFPTDLHNIVAKIIAEIFNSLDGQQQSEFLRLFISQTKGLVLETNCADEENMRESEQKYQLFPKTLMFLVSKLTNEFIFLIFEYIFGKIKRN